MNITVYLPDELGREAKESKLNLSRLLRTAVERELEPIRRQRREQQLIAHLDAQRRKG